VSAVRVVRDGARPRRRLRRLVGILWWPARLSRASAPTTAWRWEPPADDSRQLWKEVERRRAERRAEVTAADDPGLVLSGRRRGARRAVDRPAVEVAVVAQRERGKRRRLSKRFVFLVSYVLSLGAVAALVAGASFGMFSATASSSTSTFSSGTVTLGQSASTTCSVSPLAPGAGTSAGGGTPTNATELQCSLTVSYSGNVPAWLGLDVSIASTHAGSDPYTGLTGAPGLYDGTATGLQVLIKDGTTTYMDSDGSPTGTTAGTFLGGSAATGASPSVSDLLVSTTPFTSLSGPVTFTVDYSLPSGSTNAYMGAASSITLTAHAVQSGNNGSTSLCTAGRVCAGINGWS
jgi:hypothetical protein